MHAESTTKWENKSTLNVVSTVYVTSYGTCISGRNTCAPKTVAFVCMNDTCGGLCCSMQYVTVAAHIQPNHYGTVLHWRFASLFGHWRGRRRRNDEIKRKQTAAARAPGGPCALRLSCGIMLKYRVYWHARLLAYMQCGCTRHGRQHIVGTTTMAKGLAQRNRRISANLEWIWIFHRFGSSESEGWKTERAPAPSGVGLKGRSRWIEFKFM